MCLRLIHPTPRMELINIHDVGRTEYKSSLLPSRVVCSFNLKIKLSTFVALQRPGGERRGTRYVNLYVFGMGQVRVSKLEGQSECLEVLCEFENLKIYKWWIG